MNDRLRLLRNALHLSQEEFGKRVGVTKTAISRLESGSNRITDRMLKLISREFNVDIDWLETGRGEMFLPISDDALDDFAVEFGLSDIAKEFIGEFVKFPPSEQEELLGFLRRLFGNKSSETEK